MDFSNKGSVNGWLSFIAHEFFHLYNVKTIRPVALGPFDYDKENYTTMLWFSVQAIDYSKYLAYAGLGIDTDPVVTEGWLGINTRESNGSLLITGVEWDSPAYKAGLSPQDVITEINGEKATAESLKNTLSIDNQKSKLSKTVTHREKTSTVEVVPGKKSVRSFEIKLLPDPTREQTAIFEKWLKE